MQRMALSVICTMIIATCVYGQDYPSKPVRLVTSNAGGGGDLLARLIAQGISAPLGQQVIVDNRASNLAGEIVAQARPDGYTLLLLGNVLWLEPLMRETRYDVVRDFNPISMVGTSPNVLVIHPSLPVRNIKELIGLSNAHPGVLNYATSGAGSISELAAELFESMAGIKMVAVPYKGASLALNALVGGEVQLMFVTSASAMAYINAKRLKALAVTSATESALTPGLPTVSEAGLPGYESVSYYGIFVPAQTPVAVINRLNQEIVRCVTGAETRRRFLDVGVEALGSTPDDLEESVKADIARMKRIFKGSMATS